MPAIQLKVTGARRLSAKLNGIAEGLRGDLLLTAAQVGALAVEGDAKLSAPVASGKLRSSIHRTVVKNEPNIAIVAVGTPVYYARFVEFGTRKMPAQPFLRPALRKNRSVVRRAVAGTIGSLLRRRFGI